MRPHHQDLTALHRGVSFNDTATIKYKYRHLLPLLSPFLAHQPPQPPSIPRIDPPSYLALMTFGQAAFSYNLTQLGYPDFPAPSTQHTEPFWYQYDQVEQLSRQLHQFPIFGYTHYNFIYDPFSMQDFVPVFIGSNTANGKVLTVGAESSKRGKYRGDELTKPFGRVHVYIGDNFVDDAQLKDLTRFSLTIGARFLKRQQDGQGEASSVEKLGFTVEVLRADGARVVKLINSHSRIWAAPPAWAFAEVLGWMIDVRNLPRTQEVPQFGVEDMEHFSLHELVDVYAATVILDLRPKPIVNAFRGHIIRHLAYMPATAEDFQYLHEHLPVGDVVLKKMIDTFFMHGERFHYKQRNLRGEVSRVQEYVNECGHQEFRGLVIGIMERRNKAALEKKEGLKGKGKAATEIESAGQDQGTAQDQVADGAVEDEAAQTPPSKATMLAESVDRSPKDSALGSPPKESKEE